MFKYLSGLDEDSRTRPGLILIILNSEYSDRRHLFLSKLTVKTQRGNERNSELTKFSSYLILILMFVDLQSIGDGLFLKVPLLDVSTSCILFVWRRQTELSCCLIIFKIFFTADDNLFYFQCLYWALKLNTLKIATMLCVMQFFSTFNSCIIVNCWLYCQWFISAKIWGPSSSLLLLSACLGPGPCWCKLRTRQGL